MYEIFKIICHTIGIIADLAFLHYVYLALVRPEVLCDSDKNRIGPFFDSKIEFYIYFFLVFIGTFLILKSAANGLLSLFPFEWFLNVNDDGETYSIHGGLAAMMAFFGGAFLLSKLFENAKLLSKSTEAKS